MKAIKIAGIVVGVLVVLCVVGALGLKLVLDAGYFKGYNPGTPLDPAVADVQEKPGYMRTLLYFNGYRDERVPTLLATPKNSTGRYPCVIFLHGIGQKKEFLDAIAEPFVKAGFVFVSFDQYMQGERKLKDPSAFEQFEAFRLRPAYTVIDTRRLIDYLQTRPDIAADRIYLSGASYGAITGSTAAAFDQRIRAVALTYGGGSIRLLLQSREAAGEIGPWMFLARALGWLFLDVADPVHYVGQIAPRPVFLQNGTNDSLISAAAAKALQDAAREPKTIKWYEGDHIGFDEATVRVVLNDILEFFKEQDAQMRQSGQKAKPAA